MLFPPPGVRIRRTLETQYLTDQPTMIAEHDPKRVLLVVALDGFTGASATFAGNKEGLSTVVEFTAYGTEAYHFWGGEEVWAQYVGSASPPAGNILIQSVFYD